MADPNFHGGMTPSNPGAEDSLHQFATSFDENGRVLALTPERQAFVDGVIGDILAQHSPAAPGEQVAVLLGGGPGAGKTTTLIEAGIVELPPDAVTINADELKEALPEYRAMGLAGDPTLAAFTHEESSYMAKQLTRQAAAGGYNIVIDGTGDSSQENLSKKIGHLQDQGYFVRGDYATIPTDLAVDRAEDRADRPAFPGARVGRVVPESVIRETHAGVSRVLPKIIEEGAFDEVRLYDTTMRNAVLIARASDGRTLDVVDRQRYSEFLAKAS
jgi:predicted ABC-type ATPase